MRCATCNGTGKFPSYINVCMVCKGRGILPDTRINNPRCPTCNGTGTFPSYVTVCSVCQGWGRLPGVTTKQLSQDLSRLSRIKEELLLAKKKQFSLDKIESKILKKLQATFPSAAASYEQAILDLKRGSRRSMRGTALELREALRDVLDKLAPDDEVKKMAGFKLEDGQKMPTMRQKARFVLRSRGYSKTSSKTLEDAVSVVEESVAELVRSVYGNGSLMTHVASDRSRVKQLKMYIDTVLSELLDIHGTP